jgi:hypothetical protein
MEQLQNEMQEHHGALDSLLKSVRTRVDPARKEARIRATRERIEGLEKKQQCERSNLLFKSIRISSKQNRRKNPKTQANHPFLWKRLGLQCWLELLTGHQGSIEEIESSSLLERAS